MKDETRKRIGKSIWTISIALFIVTGLFILLATNETFVQKHFQRSIQKMDSSMQKLIDKGLNHEELEKTNTGLTIFMSDTLVFWNRNDVSPKLMKRKWSSEMIPSAHCLQATTSSSRTKRVR